MKAAVYVKAKSGKVLRIDDVQRPRPKDNEVLLRVLAASVNPLDWRMKRTRPGVDAAGHVEAVGNKVTRFKAGDAVLGACRGAFAEYACARESALAPMPDNITFEQAAAVPVAGLTALQALRDKGRLQSGQRVLINGAAGGVGTFSVQIAKSLGAHVTGVCSSRNVELVSSLGADHVIDYAVEDFTQIGVRYDLILDNVGNRSFSELRRALNPHGRCVLAGAPKAMSSALFRGVCALLWPPFLPQRFKLFLAKARAHDLGLLCELMKVGKLTPVIEARYRLDKTSDAIAYIETGHARGKIVITMYPFARTV